VDRVESLRRGSAQYLCMCRPWYSGKDIFSLCCRHEAETGALRLHRAMNTNGGGSGILNTDRREQGYSWFVSVTWSWNREPCYDSRLLFLNPDFQCAGRPKPKFRSDWWNITGTIIKSECATGRRTSKFLFWTILRSLPEQNPHTKRTASRSPGAPLCFKNFFKLIYIEMWQPFVSVF
jgi:hypothetical protein